MRIKILNFHKILYQGDIISITAPGIQGYFQILKNHAPFISILMNGSLKLELKNIKKEIKIESGILQVKKNMIIVIL
ncbi:F0F1 ATP synthase subunit epsilon [Blattabacterium cuenoti]|uniref:ATP synthase F1 subunit epsilon n=1 Tax=Blattabacterium cuenoti STAT TaxID=1457030 RepID=A0A224AKY8_9FLAO|nr:F0F1 ATP synthase subunit epsilon [Blattabacterium cuenoti]BBA17468.1 ATP synthase F1 subunit epsilon [Blattabacterium cuenoti STAT]